MTDDALLFENYKLKKGIAYDSKLMDMFFVYDINNQTEPLSLFQQNHRTSLASLSKAIRGFGQSRWNRQHHDHWVCGHFNRQFAQNQNQPYELHLFLPRVQKTGQMPKKATQFQCFKGQIAKNSPLKERNSCYISDSLRCISNYLQLYSPANQKSPKIINRLKI